MNELVRRYAQALYELTQDEKGLCESARPLYEDPELWRALVDPTVRPAEKQRVLDRVKPETCPPVVGRFLRLLCGKGRMELLPEIVAEFHSLALGGKNAAQCVLTCVRTPGEQQLEAIKKRLCALHHRDSVELVLRHDPALLGGFVLDVEGVRYDESARGRLNGLSRKLQVEEVCAQ